MFLVSLSGLHFCLCLKFLLLFSINWCSNLCSFQYLAYCIGNWKTLNCIEIDMLIFFYQELLVNCIKLLFLCSFKLNENWLNFSMVVEDNLAYLKCCVTLFCSCIFCVGCLVKNVKIAPFCINGYILAMYMNIWCFELKEYSN